MPIDPRTRGTLPPDPGRVYPAVTSADMNNVYVALVDLSRRISELEGQRTAINDQSITTGMVKTGAITTSTIAAGSITAAQIQVGNVVASIMTVGAVNASHIDSASIRASVLDATVLTATNAYITSLRASILDAGVLTAASAQIGTLRTSILNSTQIITQGLQTQVLNAVNAAITTLASFNVTSGTITADLIRTAASGSRVEVGATAGGIKGYNSSGVMTFGFDTTTGTATVGAIAVTGANGTQVPASTLTGFVGGGNLLKDSSFESTDPALPAALWTATNATMAKSSTQAFHGTKALRITAPTATNGQAATDLVVNHGVPIVSLRNRPVVLSAWVYITGTDNSAPSPDRCIQIATDAVNLASVPISTIPKNTWTRVVVKDTIPVGANNVYAVLYNPYTSGLNTVYYDGVQFELGDAATAYSPKADEIIYGSITAVEIAASSIDATRMNVSTLSAISANMGTITAGTITGATFQSSASNPAVRFDSTGFYITDSTGAHAVDMKSSGFQLTTPTSAAKVDRNSINWVRPSDSYVDFSLWNWSNPAGSSAANIEKIVPTTDTGSNTATLQALRKTGATVVDSAAISVTTNSVSGTLNTSRVEASARTASGTLQSKIILAGDGTSDYLFNNPSTTLGLSNGWVTQSSHQPLHYWTDGAAVHVRGTLDGASATSNPVVTLASQLRPATIVRVPITYWNGTSDVAGAAQITSGGALNILGSGDAFAANMRWVALNLSYRTDR